MAAFAAFDWDEMNQRISNIEAAADRRADQRLFWFIGFMLAVSLLIQASTAHTELLRINADADWREPWIKEATSHFVIFLLAPLIARILDRAPVSLQAWRWSAPIHLGGIIGFSVLHVTLMYAARKILLPLLAGASYDFNLLAPGNFLYEFQKDIFTYALLVFGFVTNRSLEQRRLELEEVRKIARGDKKLTLKSGGSTFLLDAADVLWAKAAGNYVEIATGRKTFLARMTLTGLERLLAEAEQDHIRVHRSHLVRGDKIVLIKPTGEGDVTIEMSDGTILPGSRRYRDLLPDIAETSKA